MNNIEELIGKTFVKIDKSDDEIIFHVLTGESWRMYPPDGDFSEGVFIEDICGDIKDLLNTPIVQAFEKTSDENPIGITKDCQDSFTWTFYTLATIKGTVTIRWYGESNGYYSEAVTIERITKAWKQKLN